MRLSLCLRLRLNPAGSSDGAEAMGREESGECVRCPSIGETSSHVVAAV